MAVIQNEDGVTFDFICERDKCGFTSRKWTTSDQAVARRDMHYNEHDTGEVSLELIEFEQLVGFVRPDAVEQTVEPIFDPASLVVADPEVTLSDPEPAPEA